MNSTAATVKTINCPPAPTFSEDRERRSLEMAINNMDSLADGAFEEISAIAKLAMFALERPGMTAMDIERIAIALRAIFDRAKTTNVLIHDIASEAGFGWHDEAFYKRLSAR